VLLERAGASLPAGSALAALTRTSAAAAALVLWGALCVLAFHGVRRRALFWIAPCGLFTVLALSDPTPSVAFALLLTIPVVARWRWQDSTDRRALGFALLAAFILPIAAFAPVPGDRAAETSPGFLLVAHAAWARELAGLYFLFALPGLLERWSVGVRRVSRRLAMLLLSSLVPVLLVMIMWGFSTQLGVRAERALFAARLVEQAAAGLRASLIVAREARPAQPDPLLAMTEAYRHWPGLRLWRGGVRVRGAAIADETALRLWPDSLPSGCMVMLGNRAWLGARTTGIHGDTLTALVPLQEVLDTDIQRLVGARIKSPSLTAARTDTAGAESIWVGSETGRRTIRGAPDSSGINLSFRGRRMVAGGDFNVTAGHGLLNGIAWNGQGWERQDGLLSVDLSWGAVALGLFEGVRENPVNILSLALLGLLASLLAMVAGADFAMVRAPGRSITAAVVALRRGAEQLEAGDLSHRIPVEDQDDLWDVAGAFNRMAVGLERGRDPEIERQRIEDELALARRIQARLLPTAPPEVEGLELAGTSESAREVGGDYYDYLPLGDGRVALVIADVSGKGVGAALLMSGFRASLLSQDLAGTDVAEVVGRLNHFLHRSVEPGKFVTAFLGVLDGRSGQLVYCNAGHNAPLLVGTDGKVTRLETAGLILGILEHSPYEAGQAMLRPGERLVLFTDGVTEAANESDEQWGEERLLELLRSAPQDPCAGVMARIVEEVRRFEGARGASDDVTLIVARRGPGISASS
jgi:HAMP domain-containing protein